MDQNVLFSFIVSDFCVLEPDFEQLKKKPSVSLSLFIYREREKKGVK